MEMRDTDVHFFFIIVFFSNNFQVDEIWPELEMFVI